MTDSGRVADAGGPAQADGPPHADGPPQGDGLGQADGIGQADGAGWAETPAWAGGPPDPDRPADAPLPTLCATEPTQPLGAGGTTEPTPAAGGGESVISGREVWSFVSAPQLRPMRVAVTTHRSGTAPGQIFVAPYSRSTMVGQTGTLILGDGGEPVWFRPLPSPGLRNADFRVQTWYDPTTGTSQPVLAWWQGPVAETPGGAESCFYVYDSQYRLRQTVTARHGFRADADEFLLTQRGTALFIASRVEPMDLRPYGGPTDGAILNSEVQEVDLSSGELLFSWNVREHVDPAESQVPASDAVHSGGVWDAYQVNSVDEGPDGQLLISARNTWAVYAVDRDGGAVQWRLGGRRSDFTLDAPASFAWQRDARFRSGNRISLVGDGCCDQPGGPPEQPSYGLTLDLDFDNRRATVDRTYHHKPALSSRSQGNLQALPNGNEFVGWGQSPYYSEYAGDGNARGDGQRNLLYDARMPGENVSSRAFRSEWVGTPYYPPSVAVRRDGAQSVVHASWNGSTQTRAWQLLAGPDPESLTVVVEHAMRTGFETTVGTANPGPYFQVRALDQDRAVLSTSAMVRLDG
ncbi:arylsulfotransferase family protein [Micromonospora sp. CA-263727]|uniref:arylsulfotransferase family protein n=1 Tax=Micromonospora sp. CA-263727 TaxID=3239967 RepID=UPI003D902EA8